MIIDMVIWGFFSAMGWMSANWVVDKVIPPKPQECVVIESEKQAKVCEIHNSK